MAIDTSLTTVTLALPALDVSALLVAAICTVAGVGRSAGAMYTPVALIVPVALFPPATPFTLQVTLTLLAFVTVAAKVCVFPSSTELFDGVTLTVMAGGGGAGGGATVPVPPAAQPGIVAPAARSTINSSLATSTLRRAARRRAPRCFVPLLCGRGHMPSPFAGEGPAKIEHAQTRILQAAENRPSNVNRSPLRGLREAYGAVTASFRALARWVVRWWWHDLIGPI